MNLTKTIAYEWLSFQCPAAWEDITDQVEGDDVPFTVADDAAGVGVLQFTLVRYVEGELPNIDEANLREMLLEYVENFNLGQPTEVDSVSGKLLGVKATFHDADTFVCFWFLSDGTNLVMATYNCDWESRDVEWDVVQAIMASAAIDAS